MILRYLYFHFLNLIFGNLSLNLGYMLGNKFAIIVSKFRFSKYVSAIRANQWIVDGKKYSSKQLDNVVTEVIRHSAEGICDLFYCIHNPGAVKELITLSPSTIDYIERHARGERGTVVVFPHLSTYYLMLMAIAEYGIATQLLSFPSPTINHPLQNYFQSEFGVDITPISVSALLRATKHLKSGGMVAGAVDVHDMNEGNQYRLDFFSLTARVPTYHVSLAQKMGVPVIVAACFKRNDNTYYVDISAPIKMQSGGDRYKDTEDNAQAVLRVVESFIKIAPLQWQVFYPVWPEAMAEMP